MQRTKRAKIILKKKRQVGEHRPSDSKTYYKAIAIKTMCYWHKKRQIDGLNRMRI